MVGFPHSESPGSKLIRSSPRLIAAYYVLHRLHAPRHPLDALKALDRSHYRCPQRGTAPLETPPSVIGQERYCHVIATWRFDRSDQKYQNSRALLSLGRVYLKRAAKHLFTMSKDPAAARPKGRLPPNLLSVCDVFGSAFAVVSPGNGGARRDRTDDILLAKQALSQLSYGPITETGQQQLVGPGRLELPTSRLSGRSEEHTSELQSRENLVCRLLLAKKNR